jgi:hypothetical protein
MPSEEETLEGGPPDQSLWSVLDTHNDREQPPLVKTDS